MERMVLRYDDQARSNGVIVVPGCGFDSIPADLGFVQLLKIFDKSKVMATNIQSFLHILSGPSGVAGHYATYESAVHGFASINQLKKIRKELKMKESKSFGGQVVHPGKGLKLSSFPEFDKKVKKWVVPFPGADASVVRRTTQTLYKEGTRKNFPRFYAMYAISSTFYMIVGVILATLLQMFARYEFGRKILLQVILICCVCSFSLSGGL